VSGVGAGHHRDAHRPTLSQPPTITVGT
jgi:hypothetical protein